VLEIHLPAIYRARSTAPNGEWLPQIDDGSGLPETHVLMAPVCRLRTVPAAPPVDEDGIGFGTGPVSVVEDDVSIDELLDSERTEEREPIDTRIARLAWLLGVAAIGVVLLILMFAIGTDVPSVFRSLPGA
jgi:hypothetical protein